MAGEIPAFRAGTGAGKEVEGKFIRGGSAGEHERAVAIAGEKVVVWLEGIREYTERFMPHAGALKPSFALPHKDGFPAVAFPREEHLPQQLTTWKWKRSRYRSGDNIAHRMIRDFQCSSSLRDSASEREAEK